MIVRSVASLKVDYHFLYLIPTVHKQQFGGTALRFSQQAVQKLATGEPVVGEVYPVPLPKEVYTALPDLDTTPLADVALALELIGIQISLVAERNKLSFARSMLDMQAEEEAQLFHHYEDEVKMRLQQLHDACTLLQESAREEDSGEAQQEWRSLWKRAVMMVECFTNLSDVSASETQQAHVDVLALEMLLAKYMNRKYLGK